MPTEDELGWEYFGNAPETSPLMMEHMDWHNAPENQNRTGNYGERFLIFHRDYVAKFDAFRATKGLLPVSGWDPTTQIPAALAHPKKLHALRDTDFPYSIAPGCRTPTWCTVAGGTEPAPGYGYTSLTQFRSLDELGRAIDSGWHGTVHNTIGGDMKTFDSPIDPIFWRWHKWIDTVRSNWEVAQVHIVAPHNIALLTRILFGVTNDAPGVIIGPDGVPHHVGGGPGGDPVITVGSLLPAATRDALVGQLVQHLALHVDSSESRKSLQQTAVKLLRAEKGR